MRYSEPYLVTAGQREAGTVCTACGCEVQQGDPTALCRSCGAVHHESCWALQGGCGSYQCFSGKVSQSSQAPVLSVSRAELDSAVPLPTRTNPFEGSAEGERNPPEKRWNRTAIWAFAIALVGIPLFGLVTGLVAIIVGCIALVVQTADRRGLWMGVAGVLLGFLDVIGWSVGLYFYLGNDQHMVSLEEFTAPDMASIEALPEHLGRAMRANVIVRSSAGFARQGLGSGVILKIQDGIAWIVTNRHVIDHDYSEDTTAAIEDLSSFSGISIQTVSESMVPAKVEWVAPHGVDLAILSSRLNPEDIASAHWNIREQPRIGDEVFAVGNPHGLGWTHSAGEVSQVRRRQRGVFMYRVLQSTAALNPGNSGGGLYDESGRLIGINTLTGDKRFAEGLGFSISLPTLLELLPANLSLPEKNPETETP